MIWIFLIRDTKNMKNCEIDDWDRTFWVQRTGHPPKHSTLLNKVVGKFLMQKCWTRQCGNQWLEQWQWCETIWSIIPTSITSSASCMNRERERESECIRNPSENWAELDGVFPLLRSSISYFNNFSRMNENFGNIEREICVETLSAGQQSVLL